MGLDVLLINPPFRMAPPFKYTMIDPPRNLTIIAAWLERQGISVKIFDMGVLELPFEEIGPAIRRERPRIVGISNRSTYNFPMVRRTAQEVKAVQPDTPVVVGGTYVTWMPDEALQKAPEIDYVVVGEGDISGPELMRTILEGGDPSQVRGIAYRNAQGAVVLTPEAELIEDLDQVPFPANHLLPIERYVERQERYILSLGRGCLYRCAYCTSSFVRGRMRYRSVPNMMAEIRSAYDLGFRYFYFFDDIFTVNRVLVMELCDAICESGLSFEWHCMTRTENVDWDLLVKMKQAGCDLIAYGVESANAEVLKDLKRGSRHVREAFHMTREAGIRPLAFVMFGLPGATFTDEMVTIRYLVELQPDAVRDFSFKPYPGTPYYADPEGHGIHIFDYDFCHWSQLDEPVHRTEQLTEHEIIEARMVCNYLFRSKGTFSPGEKYRRRKGVIIVKTGEGGLLYNPFRPAEKRKTDFYLNCMKLNEVYYEVLLRCDGYHNTEDIAHVIHKLFDLEEAEAKEKVEQVIEEANKLNLLEIVPDFTLLSLPEKEAMAQVWSPRASVFEVAG